MQYGECVGALWQNQEDLDTGSTMYIEPTKAV